MRGLHPLMIVVRFPGLCLKLSSVLLATLSPRPCPVSHHFFSTKGLHWSLKLDPHTFPKKYICIHIYIYIYPEKQSRFPNPPSWLDATCPGEASHRGKEPSDGEPAEDLSGGGFKGTVFTDVPCSAI